MRFRTGFIAPSRLLLLFGLLVLMTACSGSETEEMSQAASPLASEQVKNEVPPMQEEGSAQVSEQSEEAENGPQDFYLTSPEFSEGEPIPAKFSCDGENSSPALAWGGKPEGTASFVLIMDDPDAPGGTWVHWLLFDIPADEDSLSQAVVSSPALSGGSIYGQNSWGRSDYGGPCPPGGTHRYFFKLYALDQTLGLPQGVAWDMVLSAMQGHILGEASLMGTYSR